MPSNYSSTSQTGFSQFFSVFKKVIFAAGRLGLEEAGSRFFGGMTWRVVKELARPVIEDLKERFGLSDYAPDDANAQENAAAAAKYLSADHNLQSMLRNNFSELKQGHQEILASIRRVSKQMEEFKESWGRVPAQQALPTYVDCNDFANIVYQHLIETAPESSWGAAWLVMLAVVTAGYFKPQVLENGESFVTYRTEIIGSKYTAMPHGRFTNDRGHICRRCFGTAQLRDRAGRGALLEKQSGEDIWARIQGKWTIVDNNGYPLIQQQ